MIDLQTICIFLHEQNETFNFLQKSYIFFRIFIIPIHEQLLFQRIQNHLNPIFAFYINLNKNNFLCGQD